MTAGPRERLITSTIALVREHGVEGTGLTELINHSGAARGSIYQHFPGGKADLVEAATYAAGRWVSRSVASLAALGDPEAIVTAIVEATRLSFEKEHYRYGCPVAAAASSGPGHTQAEQAAAAVFADWQAALASVFGTAGIEAASAESFASFVISALEGAILRSRASGTSDAFHAARIHLCALALRLSNRIPQTTGNQ